MTTSASDTAVAAPHRAALPGRAVCDGPPRRPAAAAQRAAGADAVDARGCEDDDASLAARCARGDAGAWRALVDRYQRLVYAIVLRMGIDEHGAADVFQTVFARLVQHLPRIADPSRLQAWIVTTAKREALLQRKLGLRNVSMTRADDAHDDVAEWDRADEAPIAEEALEELQQLNLLRVALERLDQRCRDLLLLLFRSSDEPVSYEDAALRLSTPVGSIGPTRARCLDKLRRSVS